jgi:hypothetical protein
MEAEVEIKPAYTELQSLFYTYKSITNGLFIYIDTRPSKTLTSALPRLAINCHYVYEA